MWNTLSRLPHPTHMTYGPSLSIYQRKSSSYVLTAIPDNKTSKQIIKTRLVNKVAYIGLYSQTR